MHKPLVSIVSPCYNVALYIPKFLDSLLAQTYKNLEIILVNDGSTDKTNEIIISYLPKLRKEGYSVKHIEQSNQGLSGAINTGIKHVTGSYMTWPDPDDWLTPDSIEKRVDFLEKNPQVALVRSNYESIEDGSGTSLGVAEPTSSINPWKIDNFFEKLVFVKTWFGALTCMVRVSCFDKVISNRDIYVCRRAGQNWQLLLPIAYHFECWQLPDVLGYYLIRKNSHSRQSKNYASCIAFEYDFQDTLTNTLQRINGIDKNYIKLALQQYCVLRLGHAKFYRKRLDIWRFSFELMSYTPHFFSKLYLLIVAMYHSIVKTLLGK